MKQKGPEKENVFIKAAKYGLVTLSKVREYKIPFTLTTYEIPLSKRKHFVEERKDQRKMIFKEFSAEQVENLPSLGYAD